MLATFTCFGHHILRSLYGDEDGVEKDDKQDGKPKPARFHQLKSKLPELAPTGDNQLVFFNSVWVGNEYNCTVRLHQLTAVSLSYLAT